MPVASSKALGGSEGVGHLCPQWGGGSRKGWASMALKPRGGHLWPHQAGAGGQRRQGSRDESRLPIELLFRTFHLAPGNLGLLQQYLPEADV
jgi:hypothetical protein